MNPNCQANFLPLPLRIERRTRLVLRRTIVWASTYLGCLLVGTLAAVAYAWSSEAPVQAVLVQADIERTEKALQACRRQLIDAERRLASTSMLTDQPDLSLLLPIIGQQANGVGSLEDLRIEPASAEKSHELLVSVRGVAGSYAGASELVLRLEQLKLFKSVLLQRTDRMTAGTEESVSFEIRCSLEGGGSD